MNHSGTTAMPALLPDWGALRVSGEDAGAFLQGQATTDVLALKPGQTGCGAFCNPKGRVIANFRIGRQEQGFVLFVSADLIEPLSRRLQMYVLRSRVKLENLAGLSAVAGAFETSDALEDSGEWTESWALKDDSGRRIGLLPLDGSTHLENESPPAAWELADIATGFARITSATREEFLPQMLNLDWLGGIGLEKGCYTGQEIVARTHYLGQLKRRLFRFSLAGETAPMPGTALATGDNPVAGQIVNARADGNGHIHGLAVLALEAAESHTLLLGDAQGPRIQIKVMNPA
jgi:tRNA-modifying protein YgfZ